MAAACAFSPRRSDALEGAEVDEEAISRIVNMARRSFRYVVIDTFPMLDSVLMSILDVTDVAFVVVQGMAPAVAGIARLLPVLEGLGLPPSRQRLVLNYNYKPFLGNLQPSDIANRLQRTLDYVVPYERGVLTSMNTGSPAHPAQPPMGALRTRGQPHGRGSRCLGGRWITRGRSVAGADGPSSEAG